MNPETATRHAVVLVIDRVGTGFLGPYGNAWLETPEFNRLAAEGTLFENLIADAVTVAESCTSYWTGLHAARDRAISGGTEHGRGGAGASLIERLIAGGAAATIVSDDPAVLHHPLATHFSQHVLVPIVVPPAPAPSIDEQHLASVFAAACEALPGGATPSLLWVHVSALDRVWDAPLALREQFRDEGDPLPSDCTVPPSWHLVDPSNPDELLPWLHAYAGQILALDACLGRFLAVIRSQPSWDSTLLVVTSPRGFALGAGDCVGASGDSLASELVQTPLLIRLPDATQGCQRRAEFVQPADLAATLSDWFGLEPPATWRDSLSLLRSLGIGTALDHELGRSLAFAVHDGEQSLRTRNWYLRRSADSLALFAKPDDRWEVNEVSVRCGEIPECLGHLLARFLANPDLSPFGLSSQELQAAD